MTVRPLRLAAMLTTLACAAFGLTALAGPAAQAAAASHGVNHTLVKAAAGDSCDPGDGDTGTADDAGDCIDN
jgi:hypothetical protein